jgi:Mg-chelatase subunit ChlD
MDELISLVAAIYECLRGVSIRSLIYAVADVYARSQLGEVNREKLIEILAQNLAGALRADPHAAKKMVEDAITCVQNTGGPVAALAVGSVGSEKAPTLAHIVNRHVPVDASPRVKLEVVRRLDLPKEALEETRSSITARSEGALHMKSAVKIIKHYHPYVSATDVDMIKTAMAVMRKTVQNKPLSDSDIYIREYVHIVDKPIYVALDVSGSMKEYVGNKTKLKVAKGALIKYLRQMAYLRGSVSLVLFNTEAEFMWIPHPVHVYLREMAEIVKYIYAMGGTELASALELLHSHGIRREVVVISDGRTTDTERVLNLARRFRRLHVVATERSMFLRQIAKTTGGRYGELTPTLDIFGLHS